MAPLRVRIDEGSQNQPQLLWDTQWSPPDGFGDWVIAGPTDVGNIGGLRARSALHTAIVIALFTDRRMPDDHQLRKLIDDGDPRGWWGDGVDIQNSLGEAEMGSLLWIFARSYLNDDIRKWVEALAIEALAPLLFQRVAVRIDAQAVMHAAINRCDLTIQLYGRSDKKIYDFRFDDIWSQTAQAPAPLPFPQFPTL